jgi:hypothetical protein
VKFYKNLIVRQIREVLYIKSYISTNMWTFILYI